MADPNYKTIRKDSNGDLAVPFQIISGRDAVGQRIFARLRFFLGEWFLDRRLGVPYYRDIFKKNPNIDLVRSIFRDTILRTPGVQKFLNFDLEWDQQLRQLTLQFEVRLSDGNIFRSQPDEFIVQVR